VLRWDGNPMESFEEQKEATFVILGTHYYNPILSLYFFFLRIIHLPPPKIKGKKLSHSLTYFKVFGGHMDHVLGRCLQD
jgi:hypothetical protein